MFSTRAGVCGEANLFTRKQYFFEELHSAAAKRRAALMRPMPIVSKLTLSSLETCFLTSDPVSQSSNGHIAARQRFCFFLSLRVTIKEVFSGLMQLLTASCFLKSESFSQFGHNFLKVCFVCVCEPERLRVRCGLTPLKEVAGVFCSGAITVLHCSSVWDASSILSSSKLKRAARACNRSCVVHRWQACPLLASLRPFCCAIRKLMHHPPFWPHAVTFLPG